MAVHLMHSGAHEVIVCARRALPELTLESPQGSVTVRPQVLTDPQSAAPVDWILVATKSYDAAATASWFSRLGASGAPVAILQNGVEHRERFAPYLPAERVLPVVVYCPAERTSPELILQRRRAQLEVPEGSVGRRFAALFVSTPVEVTPVVDFQSALWRKLCVNAPGAVCALLLQPSGVTRDEGVGEIVRQLVHECAAVGRAEGAFLDDDLPERILQRYRAEPPATVNSLYADRVAGRPMETDARNGAIVRLGKRHGIPTPTNQMAVALLEALSAGVAPVSKL
jgi:2-dehydropantoate 2-reductase